MIFLPWLWSVSAFRLVRGVALGLLIWTILVWCYSFIPLTAEAVAVVAPPANQSPSLSSLSSLSSLMGLEPNQSDAYSKITNMLSSPAMAYDLLSDDGKLRIIFPERWQQSTNRWHRPFSITSLITRPLHSVFGDTLSDRPTLEETGARLRSSVRVTQVSLSSLREIGFKAPTPSAAQAGLVLLLREGDQLVKQANVAELRGQVDHLRQLMRETNEVDLRMALASLTAGTELKLASVTPGNTFSFRQIGSVAVERSRIFLSPILSLAIGYSFFFALLGVWGLGQFANMSFIGTGKK